MRKLVLEVLDQQRAGVRVVMLADVEPGALGGRRRVLHLLRVQRRPVHHRQVVLLHRVLDVDLPVAVHLMDALAHQREIVEPVGPHQFGEVAEVVGQRRRVVVEIDEDEAAAGLQPELAQPVPGGIEVLRPFHPRRAVEPAVEIVHPAVIGAGEGAAVALAVRHRGSAVAAVVGERAELPVPAADDQDRHADIVDGDEIAGFRHLVDMAEEIPRPREQVADLQPVILLRRVAPRRQALRLLDRPEHAVEGGTVDRRGLEHRPVSRSRWSRPERLAKTPSPVQ